MLKKVVICLFLVSLCLTGCSDNSSVEFRDEETSIDKSEKVEENGFEIAKYKNFDDVKTFRETDVYIEGTISKVENGDIIITDEEGYYWAFTDWNKNHDFEKYIGKNCICYCKTYGISSLDKNTIMISLEESNKYKVIFDDKEVYSQFDNCTMHNDYDKKYIAFGGSGDDGTSEYNIFDLSNNTVRNLKFQNKKWYYADASYDGLVFHEVDAKFSNDYSIHFC